MESTKMIKEKGQVSEMGFCSACFADLGDKPRRAAARWLQLLARSKAIDLFDWLGGPSRGSTNEELVALWMNAMIQLTINQLGLAWCDCFPVGNLGLIGGH